MICPKCSNEIKDGMKFCGKCGAPVAQSAVNDDATKVFAPPTAPVQEVKPPVVQRQPVQQVAPVVPQKPKKEKKQKEKKSKKKLWAILIPVIAILLAIAILVPTVIVPWWQSRNAEPVKRRTSSVAAGYQSSVALKDDGTVLAAGLEDELQDEVTSWTEIVALDSSGYITAGVRKDGVVCFADNTENEWTAEKWTDIKNVSVSDNHAVGLKNDGTVVAEGKNDSGACDVEKWTNIVQVEAAGNNTFAVSKDGAVLVAGDKSDAASDITAWTDIVSISAGKNAVIGLKSDGTVVVAVIGGNTEYDVSDWEDIILVAVGETHAIALKADGTVLTAGDSSNGKLETSAWEKIVDIAAGDGHTIGLKEDGTAVAAGDNNNGQCDVDGWTGILIPVFEDEDIEAADGEGTTASTAKPEEKAVLSPKSAVEIYMANKDVWMGEADMYNHDYILADLDFDGVLELISTNFGGSGRFSYNYYYRIDIGNRSVVEISAENENEGGYDYTSINNDPKLYKNKSDGKMFYFATDFVKVSNVEYGTSQGKMYYDGSKICDERMFTVTTLEANSYANSTDEDIINYYVESVDPYNPISETEYDKYFSEFENNSIDLNLKWSPIEMGNFNSSDEATQKQLLLDAYQAFSYDGFSFANLKTYDLGDDNTSTSSSATLEATDADFEELRLIWWRSRNGMDGFDYQKTPLNRVIENMITFSGLGVYSYFFGETEEIYVPGEATDPLKKWEVGHIKYDAEKVEWICENIFNVEFDKNFVPNDEYGAYYYDGYIYGLPLTFGDGSWYEGVFADYKKLDNGKYEVVFETYNIPEEYVNDDNYVPVEDDLRSTNIVTAELKMIDGERHWSIYSIEKI